MKVLEWVARRLLNVQSCTCVLTDDEMENNYENSKFDIEETQALLEQHGGHMVIDVLENWKESILTIGTLAIGPLQTTNVETVVEDDDDDNTTNEDLHDRRGVLEHESNPLLNVALISHEIETEEVIGSCKEIVEEPEIEDDNGNVEAELDSTTRVTLADLLSADSSGHPFVRKLGDDHELNQGEVVSKDLIITGAKPCLKIIKPTSHGKSGLSKAKKLLKEDLHPIKKLNQLVRRMTKKKIHPDAEGKIQEDMEMHPSNYSAGLIHEGGASI